MIKVPDAAIEVLGRHIALANNAAFLWRKLSQSVTVNEFALHEDQAALLEALRELLAREQKTEHELTTIYCIAAALLLKNNTLAQVIATMPGAASVYWLLPLIALAGPNKPSTSYSRLSQGAIAAPPAGAASSSGRLILLSNNG